MKKFWTWAYFFLLLPTLSSNHPSSLGPASADTPILLYKVSCMGTMRGGGCGIVMVVRAACFFNLKGD